MTFKANSPAAALVLLFFCCGFSCAAEKFAIARNGEARAAIIVCENASAVEKHAAAELSYFLSGVTGAEIPKARGPAPGKYSIWVGTPGHNPGVEMMQLAPRVESLSDDGFLLNSSSEGLVITGKKPLGALYGAYAFLEEHVGLRWFFPGNEGEYRPDEPSLAVGVIDDIQNPSFEERTIQFDGSSITALTVDSWNWIVRNRMRQDGVLEQIFNRSPHNEEFRKRGTPVIGGGHILSRMVPDKLFEEHPEYFGLYGGERRRQDGHRGQPCTTHPEVINLAAEYMLDWFKRNPEGVFTLNNNDYPNFCECSNCRALDPPREAGRRGGDVSTRFFAFKNEAARRVWVVYPDARIRVLAYHGFRLPPTQEKPDPRLIVQLCDQRERCFRHSLDDETCGPNQWFRDMFEAWSAFENRRGNFPYYNSMSAAWWVPLEHIVAADMRYLHRLGHETWHFRTFPPDGLYRIWNPVIGKGYWRANLHTHYIQAKLAWDIDSDVEAIMRDINGKFYGSAGDAMSRYREKLRSLWGDTRMHWARGASSAAAGQALSAPNAPRDILALLEEAAAAVAEQPLYLGRIQEEKYLFETFWMKAYDEYVSLPGEIAVQKRTAGINIDGKLDDPDWQLCSAVSGFRNRDGGPAEAQTYARLLYDDTHLYVGLQMEEPFIKNLVMNAAPGHEDRIFNDDTIEIFIDPGAGGRRYAHIALNPAGVLRDSMVEAGMPPAGDTGFDSKIEYAVAIGEREWTVEMKIPASALDETIMEGSVWDMNIGRARGGTTGPNREVSTWLDGAFHTPTSFRRIVLGLPLIRNGSFDDVVIMETDALLRRHGRSGWSYGNTPPAAAREWNLGGTPGKLTIVEENVHSGKAALMFEGDNCAVHTRIQTELKEGEEYRFSFSSRGEGTITVNIYHYSIDPETKRLRGAGASRAGAAELSRDWRQNEITYVHPENYPGTARLAFHVTGKAVIDSVYASPVSR